MTDSYDSNDNDDGKPFVAYNLHKASRPVQIIVVGLLMGFTLFGIYCISIGINNMMEKPVPISNGTLDNTWCYDDRYYESKYTHEVIVYNCGIISKQFIWIGSIEEYYSWKNMRLMDGKKHTFTNDYKNSSITNAQFEVNEVGYKSEFPVRIGGIDGKFMDDYKFIIVPDNNESEAIMYSINVVDSISDPKIDIKIIPTSIEKFNSNTYYQST